MSNQNALLSVRGLTLEVIHNGGAVVKDVSFDVSPGEIVGIVGESGSGKTLATRSIIGLIAPGIRHASGSIIYKDQDTLQASDRALRRLRGGEIGVVFQEPMTSLNPSMTIGRQLEEGLVLHTKQTPEMRRTNILH
ncbi:TPA: ABC transporter ATP-binding protein, partial [Clostridioides difficile]|nr:ABC transporter ATP-binding protein [Clostridioides difficile]